MKNENYYTNTGILVSYTETYLYSRNAAPTHILELDNCDKIFVGSAFATGEDNEIIKAIADRNGCVTVKYTKTLKPILFMYHNIISIKTDDMEIIHESESTKHIEDIGKISIAVLVVVTISILSCFFIGRWLFNTSRKKK